MTRKFVFAAVVVFALAAPLQAGAVTRSMSSSATKTPPANGVYATGPRHTAHYFLSLRSTKNGTVSGSMEYLYKNGKTSVVFSFSGTWAKGVIAFQPAKIPQGAAASQKPSSVPAVIPALYTAKWIVFGGCPHYLHYISTENGCTFTPALKGTDSN